jgi:hypothetical protein
LHARWILLVRHPGVLNSGPGRWGQRTSTTSIRHSRSHDHLSRRVHWRPPGRRRIVHEHLLVTCSASGVICSRHFAESGFSFGNSRCQINLNSFHGALTEDLNPISQNISGIGIVDGFV